MELGLVGLHLRVGGRILVERLDARLSGGQFCCVLGRNGAGKSTLLRTIAGLRPAEGGTVEFDGRPLAQYSVRQQAHRRALLSQQVSDVFSSSVMDTVLSARFPFHSGLAARFGLESLEDRHVASKALSAFHLEALAERDVLSLSGGERRQVALATVLAQQVPLLLLDEPAAHLDLDVSARAFKVLGNAVAEGCCVVASVHDPNLAARHATHVILLQQDGSSLFGSARELLNAARLEAVLGQRMVEVMVDGEVRFLAA